MCGLASLHCPTCGAVMPAPFRFCGQCGAHLDNACPECGLGLYPGMRYCGHCGTCLSEEKAANGVEELKELFLPISALEAPLPVSDEAATQHHPLTDEPHRRVAVVIADIVGSTALTERLEPERASLLVSECLTGLGRVVTEHGGRVVRTQGDGLMAVFGAPADHGDDPERAAWAALQMQAWLRDETPRLEAEYGAPVRVRIGINCGSVAAAPLNAPSYDVQSEALRVAEVVEAAAEPGTVCVSESFYLLTRGTFEYSSRGVAWVKGKADPLALYQLVRPKPAEAQGVRSLPLVGREKVLGTLRRAVRQLVEGQPGYLVLTGAAGLGKTRLLEELADELSALGVRVLRGSGLDAEREGPLELWRGWLSDLLPIQRDMDPAEAAGRIRAALGSAEHESWAEWLAALAVDPQRLSALDAEARDRTVRGALGIFLRHWQQGAPAAVLVDEADALDDLSLSLLSAAAQEGRSGPLLVALTGRVSPSNLPVGAQVISLRALSALAARKLIAGVFPDGSLDPETVAHVVERAAGNPLFLTLLLQRARKTAEPASVLASAPSSLRGLIEARLETLSRPQRQVAQAAAVLGRGFPERWLSLLLGKSPESGAEEPWRTLECRGILEEWRPGPHRKLAFGHPAWQEALYEGLLKTRRRELHERAAAVLSAEAGTRADLAGRAAWHWRCAEKWDEALSWMLKAADHASALYAGEEAQATYRQCIALAERLHRPEAAAWAEARLAELAEHRGEFAAAVHHFFQAESRLSALDPERTHGDPELRALAGRVKLGHARVHCRTGALTAAQPLLAEVLALLEGSGDLRVRRIYLQALTEQAHVCRDLGQLQTADRSARRALKLAEEEGWNQEAAHAASALGRIYPLLGNWPAAERALRQAAQLAEAGGHWREAAGCWINLGSGLQSAGRLSEAAAALDHALDHARRIEDAEKMAIIRMNLGTVHLRRGDWKAAEECYRAALEQFQAMEHHLGVAHSLYNLTETLRWAGRLTESRELLKAAEDSLGRVDAAQLRPHLLLSEAELLLSADDPRGAASRASEAKGLAEELAYESGSNLARLTLGRALLARRELPAAERQLRAAVQGFEHMNAPLEEARARGELAAVLDARGRTAAARDLHQSAVDLIERLDAHPWLEHLPTVGP